MKRKSRLPLQNQHQVFITNYCCWFLQLFCLKSIQPFCMVMSECVDTVKLKHSWAPVPFSVLVSCWSVCWCEGSPFQAVLLPAQWGAWLGRQGRPRAAASRWLACSPPSWRLWWSKSVWVRALQARWPQPVLVGMCLCASTADGIWVSKTHRRGGSGFQCDHW